MSPEGKLYSTNQVADITGLNPSHIRRLATSLNVGTKMGRDWWFTESDIETIKQRPDQRNRAKSERDGS